MKDQKAKDSPGFEQVNPYAAGIDVGSERHYVAVSPSLRKEAVRVFGAYTEDLRQIAEWLKALGVKSVAMESTGQYWVGLYLMLEAYELEVCLVNAQHVKNVPGRKSDIQDCQWLQQLHSYGLLRASFQPELLTRQLRDYVRQRQRLVKDQSRSILQMHKAMDGMNIKLHEVLSDISGKSGQAIVQAILNGERNAEKLAGLADRRVKKSKADIAKALEGFWQPACLFELKQAYHRYEFFSEQIAQCDEMIEQALEEQKQKYGQDCSNQEHLLAKAAEKKKTKRKHEPKFCLSSYLMDIYGVDVCRIAGISALSGLKLLSECGHGQEISKKFRNAKAFVNWMSLCPNNKITGDKIISSRTRKNANRAAQTFRMAAMTLWNNKGPLGDYYRRMKAKKGEPKAITAAARKLAIIFYNMVTQKREYDPELLKAHAEEFEKRKAGNLSKILTQMGYTIIDADGVAWN